MQEPRSDAAPLCAPLSAVLLIVGTVRRIFGPCASTSLRGLACVTSSPPVRKERPVDTIFGPTGNLWRAVVRAFTTVPFIVRVVSQRRYVLRRLSAAGRLCRALYGGGYRFVSLLSLSLCVYLPR